MTLTSERLLDLDGVPARQESFRFVLVDSSGQEQGTLAIHEDQQPTISNDATRRSRRQVSGFKVSAADLNYVNPLHDRVRAQYRLGNGDTYSLGVFLFADASSLVRSWGAVLDASLVDECMLLDQPLEKTVGYETGKRVTDALREMAEQAGIVNVDIESSPTTLGAPVAGVPGRDTRLKLMESLSTMIGFLPPYFNNDNVLVCRSAPDLDVAKATLDYSAGTRVIADTIVASSDLITAPNRYVAVDSGSGDAPIVGYFDIPSSAPHSYENRGYVRITKTISMQGLESESAARAAAAAAYASGEDTYSWLAFDAPIDPRHDTFDIVSVDGVNYREMAWSMPCRAGAKMHHSLRGTYQTA